MCERGADSSELFKPTGKQFDATQFLEGGLASKKPTSRGLFKYIEGNQFRPNLNFLWMFIPYSLDHFPSSWRSLRYSRVPWTRVGAGSRVDWILRQDKLTEF
jgi:hypothetical protein